MDLIKTENTNSFVIASVMCCEISQDTCVRKRKRCHTENIHILSNPDSTASCGKINYFSTHSQVTLQPGFQQRGDPYQLQPKANTTKHKGSTASEEICSIDLTSDTDDAEEKVSVDKTVKQEPQTTRRKLFGECDTLSDLSFDTDTNERKARAMKSTASILKWLLPSGGKASDSILAAVREWRVPLIKAFIEEHPALVLLCGQNNKREVTKIVERLFKVKI